MKNINRVSYKNSIFILIALAVVFAVVMGGIFLNLNDRGEVIDVTATVFDQEVDEPVKESSLAGAALTAAQQNLLTSWGYSFVQGGMTIALGPCNPSIQPGMERSNNVYIYTNNSNGSYTVGFNVNGCNAIVFGGKYYFYSKLNFEFGRIATASSTNVGNLTAIDGRVHPKEGDINTYDLNLKAPGSINEILVTPEGYAYFPITVSTRMFNNVVPDYARIYLLKSGPMFDENKSKTPTDTSSILETTVDINTCSLYQSHTSSVYNGTPFAPAVSLRDTSNNKTLQAGTDYTVTYDQTDRTSIGSKSLTITGKGTYTGTRKVTWSLTELSLANTTVTLTGGTSFVYTGAAIEPKVTIRNTSGYVIPEANYNVAYLNNVNAATNAQVIITAKGSNVTSYKIATFAITKKTIAPPTANNSNLLTYNGESQAFLPPGFSATEMNITNNTQTDVGSYTSVVTLKDSTNYAWSTSTSAAIMYKFSIQKRTLTVPTASSTTFTYNGNAQTYTPTGFNASTMNISNNIQTNAGVYTVSVTMKDSTNNKWTDTESNEERKYTFTIQKKTLTVPTASSAMFTYTGNAQTYTPMNFDSNTMNISKNVQTNAGDYTVSVTMKDSANNKWTDTESNNARTYKFVIDKAEQDFTVNNITNIEVLGATSQIKPSGKFAGKFSFAVTSNTGNVATVNASSGLVTTGNKVGSATITVTSSGNANYLMQVKTLTVTTKLTNGYYTGSLTGENVCYKTLAIVASGVEEGSTVYVKGTVTFGGDVSLKKTITLQGEDGSKITRSTSSDAFRVALDKTLTLNNIEIDGNNISSTKSLIFASGNINCNSTTIKNVKSTSKVGIFYVYARSTVTINSGEFSNNNAFNAAVFGINNGTLNINGGEFKSNSAISEGGVITTQGAAKINISGGTFSENNAGLYGGVLYLDATSSAIITNCIMKNNTVGETDLAKTGDGGAIFVDNGATLTIRGGDISENTALNSGGAICCFNSANLTITGGTFSTNKATNNGGAIMLSKKTGGNVSITGGVIKGNTAQYGGAIYIEEKENNTATIPNIVIGNTTIQNNLAAEFGHAIYTETVGISIDGIASKNVTDSIGIAGLAVINVTNGLDHKLSVAFSSDTVEKYALLTDEDGNLTTGNFTSFVKTDVLTLSSYDLKQNFGVSNPGYTFGYETDDNEMVVRQLFLRESVQIAAVIEDKNGERHEFKSMQDAIDALSNTALYGISTRDNPINVYVVQQVNYGNIDSTELNFNKRDVNRGIEIPAGVHIKLESILRHAKVETWIGDLPDKMTSTYYKQGDVGGNQTFPNGLSETVSLKNPTILKRGSSYGGGMLNIADGASVSLGFIELDGGAVYDGDGPVVTDTNGQVGTAKDGNKGYTAYAPVIINEGSLTIDGGIIRNNSNNAAAPGDTFGSQYYGGAIRNEGKGTLVMNSGIIEKCYSREGGAIMNVNKPEIRTGVVNPTYVPNGNPTVTIKGGEIKNNASQMKGAAIQTIYGGATTVIEGGVINNNVSCNDLGILAVEEGGSLTIKGGKVEAGTGDTSIFLYNKYSKDDYDKAQAGSKPYIEGLKSAKKSDNVAKLVVANNANIIGDIKIDKPCVLVGTGLNTGVDEIYYEPVIELNNYTGTTLNLLIDAERKYGRVAVSNQNNLDQKITYNSYFDNPIYENDKEYSFGSRYEKVLEVNENGEKKYVKIFGGFDIKVDQNEQSILEFSGVCDAYLQSITFTINSKEYTLSTNGNGELVDNSTGGVLKIDLSSTDGNSFEISNLKVNYDKTTNTQTVALATGQTNTVILSPTEYVANVLKFDWQKGKVEVTTNTFTYIDESGQQKGLVSGELPDDIKLSATGYATFEVDSKEREIYIGLRGETPTTTEADADLLNIYNNVIEINAQEGLEYNLEYVDSTTGTKKYVLLPDDWRSLDSAIETGKIIFGNKEILTPSTEYTVIARRKAREENHIRYIPSKRIEVVSYVTLTDAQSNAKNSFEDAYETIPIEKEDADYIDSIDDALDKYYAILNATIPAPNKTLEEIDYLLRDEYLLLIDNKKEIENKKISDDVKQAIGEEDEDFALAYKDIEEKYTNKITNIVADSTNATALQTDKYIIELYTEQAKAQVDLRLAYDDADKASMREDERSKLFDVLNTGLSNIDKQTTKEKTETARIAAIDAIFKKQAEGEILAYYDSLIESNRLEELGITDLTLIDERKEIVISELAREEVGNSKEQYKEFKEYAKLELDRAEGHQIITEYVGDDVNTDNVIKRIVDEAIAYIEAEVEPSAINSLEIDEKVVQTKLKIEKERAKNYVEEELGDNPTPAMLAVKERYVQDDAIIDNQTTKEYAWFEAEKARAEIRIEELRNDLHKQIDIADKSDVAEVIIMKQIVDQILEAAINEEKSIIIEESTQQALEVANEDINSVVDRVRVEVKLELDRQANRKLDETVSPYMENIASSVKEKAEEVIKQAKEEIIANDYEKLPLIIQKAEEKIKLITEYGSIKEQLDSLGIDTSEMDNALVDVLVLIEEAVQDTNGDNDLEKKVEESIKRLTKGQADCFINTFEELTQEFITLDATDIEPLKEAIDIYDRLPESVKDVLDTDNNEEYTDYGAYIQDRINKSELEKLRDDLIARVDKIMREHDGERVRLEYAKQIAKINDIEYEEQHNDALRDGYNEDILEELTQTGKTAVDMVIFNQYQQVGVNDLKEDVAEKKGGNYEYKNKEESMQKLDEIMEKAETDILNVQSTLKEKPTDEELAIAKKTIDSIVEVAHNKIIGDVKVAGVSTGDVTPTKTSVDGKEEIDYPDTYESDKLWGIVTNDAEMEGGVKLVIEKVDSKAIQIIEKAVKEGKLTPAQGSIEEETKQLKKKVTGKEVKSTLDIYLLKHNSNVKITEFDGKYQVKVLLTEELRKIAGAQVVYVADDGSIEIYDTEIEDGKYLVFITYHFSEFYVLGEPEISLWWLITTLTITLGAEIIAIGYILAKRQDEKREDVENA